MKSRFLLALGTVMISAGLLWAQAPEEVPQLPPPAPAEGPLAPLVVENLGNGPGPAPSSPQFWATGEYLLGWFSGDRLPALVTTSPAGTPAASAGVLGATSTTTLFGDSNVNNQVRSGGRIGMGYWFTPERTLGVEAGFMIMESQATPFSASSTGTPILARPFTNSLTAVPQSALIAFPGSESGAVAAQAHSGNFYETHVDFADQFIDRGWLRVTALFGYRFFRYDEGLGIQQSIAPTGGSFVPGTRIATQDSFATQNEFHGLDFGLRAQGTWQSFNLSVLGKLAAGQIRRQVRITGSQEVSVPGAAPLVENAGLLALASNSGTFNNTGWAPLPELDLNLGWQATRNLQLTLGYSILWLNGLARAADQVDTSVNPNLLPPATASPANPDHPNFMFTRYDAWLQSITMGMKFTY